ncbi:hypothetical protein GCM10009801_47740 [Streptomyces albiaxialis]|uniref:Uncharacterized protein n=1 Tax=Streptomyces albiaxialis TaxID=329523 RepID=A0ABN2W8N6_9ACTN
MLGLLRLLVLVGRLGLRRLLGSVLSLLLRGVRGVLLRPLRLVGRLGLRLLGLLGVVRLLRVLGLVALVAEEVRERVVPIGRRLRALTGMTGPTGLLTGLSALAAQSPLPARASALVPVRVRLGSSADQLVDARELHGRGVVPVRQPPGRALGLGRGRGRPAARVRGVRALLGLLVERVRVGNGARRRGRVRRAVVERVVDRVLRGRVAVPVRIVCVRIPYVGVLRLPRIVAGGTAPVAVVRRVHGDPCPCSPG